jgi:peptidoglycan/LPS O-acetylase OafA/YrhL
MGTFRLILALAVASGHLATLLQDIPDAIGGHAVSAVRAFFAISGYYMARVLADGRYERPAHFYASRLLKLLPLYWVVSGLTILVDAAGAWRPLLHFGWQHVTELIGSPIALLYVLVSGLTLIGADTWVWLGFNPWSVGTFHGVGLTAFHFTAVPQAWTIGIELQFYLLAPLLMRLRSHWLVAIIVASLALRLAIEPAWPWDRSLFALEAPFFLAGMLAFRIWPGGLPLPARLAAIDDAIGALSYPAYLCHLLVIGIVMQLPIVALLSWWERLLVFLAAIIIASVALDSTVARPVDKLRVRLGARAHKRIGSPALALREA